jgi:hypothetical protein
MQRSSSLHVFNPAIADLAIALTLATCQFVFFTPAARAQADPFAADAVLAQGDPPLTEGMVTRFTDFQAWLLEIPFTQPQRERMRAMLLEDWKKPQEIKNDMAWLNMAADFAKVAPDVREFFRLDSQLKALDALRADKKSPDSLWLLAAYDEAHRPIAPGNPPLTESMVSHYTTFVFWLLELPGDYTLQLRLRSMIQEDWKKPKDLESDMKLLDLQLDMARYENGQVERLFARSVVQPDMVKKMRADKGNPDAQMFVAAYDTAHPTIAAGNPPLTRQATDAWTELFCFIRNQSGAPHMDATEAVKDTIARAIRESWSKNSPEQQKDLSEMPRTWALVRFAWVRNKGDERQRILAAWQPVVNPGAASDPQLAAALEAEARSEAFVKRDANAVTEQELLQAAKDADLVGTQCRRQGSQQDLVNAATWDERARLMRAGKAAYLKRAQAITQQGQNAIMEEYLKTQVMIGMLNHRSPGLSLDGTTVVMRPRSNTSQVF